MNKIKKVIVYSFCTLLSIVFTGCSDRVNDYDWKWGEIECKDKGGLRFIAVNGGNVGCKCHNGEYKNK